ncbi:hypothetical protein [Streptococcus suis]
MVISDSAYNHLAEQVYNVEPSKAKSNGEDVVVEGRTLTDKTTGQKFAVISVQDNNNDADKTNDNGMQAMAVAPIVNGQPDHSQIVVVYAGTNSADSRDIDTDTQMVIGGSNGSLVTGNVNNRLVR